MTPTRPSLFPRPALSGDGRQPSILVVNDTQEIIELLRGPLTDEGYRVTTSLSLL